MLVPLSCIKTLLLVCGQRPKTLGITWVVIVVVVLQDWTPPPLLSMWRDCCCWCCLLQVFLSISLIPLIRPLSNPCEAFCSHFSNNSLQFYFLGSQHFLTFFPSAKTLSLSLSLALSSRNGKCQFPETTASKIRKIFFWRQVRLFLEKQLSLFIWASKYQRILRAVEVVISTHRLL